MQKLRIKRQSNCIRSSIRSTWGISSYQRTSSSKHLQIKDSEQGQFKVVRENNGYCVQCTIPFIFTIFQKLSKICGTMPLAGYHPIHQVWACAHLFGTLIYSICINSSIFDGNTWSKNFQNTIFFYIFWKVWTTNTPSLNSRVVEAYISIRFENGYIPEEKHG